MSEETSEVFPDLDEVDWIVTDREQWIRDHGGVRERRRSGLVSVIVAQDGAMLVVGDSDQP